MQEILQVIEFKQPLYPHELWGTELYGIDEYYLQHEKLYAKDKELFYLDLIAHFFSEEENPCGKMFYRRTLFTPYKKHTTDYDEYLVWLKKIMNNVWLKLWAEGTSIPCGAASPTR